MKPTSSSISGSGSVRRRKNEVDGELKAFHLNQPGGLIRSILGDPMFLNRFLTYHFHLAVGLSIGLGILVFNEPDLILVDEEGLYGPLRNNLLFAVAYLLLGEIGLWATRYQKGGYFEALIMAYTFLATALGSKIYAEVNGLPLSGRFMMVLLYFALAHVLYYLVGMRKPQDPKGSEESSLK